MLGKCPLDGVGLSEEEMSELRPHDKAWTVQGLSRELLAGGAAWRDLSGHGGVTGTWGGGDGPERPRPDQRGACRPR